MNQRTLFLGGAVVVAVLAGAGLGLFLTLFVPFSEEVPEDGEASGAVSVGMGDYQIPGLYFTTMTHMEGNWKDDTDRDLFLRHVKQLRWAIALFDEYGAKLTVESEKPFAKANSTWGVNILQEVIDHGHGVGTHADFGASLQDSSITLAELTANFVENKKLVDALVGVENNRGVSGGTGYGDWVLGASAAGFEYVDAVTGFGYLSMPLSARPDGWTDGYIRNVGYHDSIPPVFEDRLYPLVLADAKNLVPDDNGVITLLSGDIGELASLAEGRNSCTPDCVLDGADVQAVQDAIDEAIALRDADRLARVNMHIPLTLLKPEHEDVLRALLRMMQDYVDAGEATWTTQGGSYDAFLGK